MYKPTTTRLFVDMDGCLTEWKATSSYEELISDGYFRELAPHESVIEAIRLMVVYGNADVYVLSSYLNDSPYALIDKRAWLDKYAPFLTKRLFCPAGTTKPQLVKDVFGEINSSFVLLDDYSKNLFEWSENGGTAVKLLNGVNGTNGTWTGLKVDKSWEPSEIERFIRYSTGIQEKSSLRAYLNDEVPFRLSNIFELPDENITEDLVESCIDSLLSDSDKMFDYDGIDAVISDVVYQKNG